MHVCAPRGRKPAKKKAKNQRDASPKRERKVAVKDMQELQKFSGPLSQIYVALGQVIGEDRLTVENIQRTYDALTERVRDDFQRRIDGDLAPEEEMLVQQRLEQLSLFELIRYTHAKLTVGVLADLHSEAVSWLAPTLMPLLDWSGHFRRVSQANNWFGAVLNLLGPGVAIPAALFSFVLPYIFMFRKFVDFNANILIRLLLSLGGDADRKWWDDRKTELYALQQLRNAPQIDQAELEKQIDILKAKLNPVPWNPELYKSH